MSEGSQSQNVRNDRMRNQKPTPTHIDGKSKTEMAPIRSVAQGTPTPAAFGSVLEFSQAYTDSSSGAAFELDPSEPIMALECSFSAWIKTTVQSQQVIFQGNNDQNNGQMCIYMQNNQLGLIWAGGPWLSTDTAPISDGNWHYIALVFNKGQVTFYKDGNPTSDSISILETKTISPQINLGGSAANIPSFVGQIWNARIWTGAFELAELQADMYRDAVESDIILLTSFDVATQSGTNLHNNTPATITNADISWTVLPANSGFLFQFSGNDPDGVNLGTIAPVTNQAATFECWMKMSTAPGVSATPQTLLLINQPNDPSSSACPRIEYNGGDQLGVFWGSEVGTCTDTKPISDGAWHHIAVVFNSGVVTFYKDGMPAAQTFTMPSSVNSANTFVIGAGVDSTKSFNGQIRDVRLWNVARSLSDIQGSMFYTFAGNEPGLVALNNLANWDPADASTQNIINQVGGTQGALTGQAKVMCAACGPLVQQTVPQNVWIYNTEGIAPLGPVLSTEGLVYAENVAASGSTPAGNFLRSLDLQTHAVNWTYSVHDNSGLTTPVIPASVGVGFANTYVAAQEAGAANYENKLELHAVDTGTGQPVWASPATLQAFTTLTKPVEGAGYVVLGANFYDPNNEPNAALYWVDAATGTKVQYNWLGSVASLMSDPIVQVVSVSGSNVAMAYVAFSYSGQDNIVMAFNLTQNEVAWTRGLSGVPTGRMTVDQNRLYVACSDGAVIAINLTDGSIAWTQTRSNQPINSRPVVVGTSVFAGSSDGNLYAFDCGTGNFLWQLDTGAAIVTDLVSADGGIYFANQADSNTPPAFYSVDTASMGNDVVTYALAYNDSILFADAQANGVIYFYGKQVIYAVNMDMTLHEFNVDTKLMVEDYDTTSNNPIGNDTSYRITIALNDPLKMPRVNQSVKIWSSDTLYLSNIPDSNGNPTMIDPDNSLIVQTDGSGQVSLAVSAYDDGSHGGGPATSTASPLISCPAVFAWANFMMPGEAIVIYPDHEHVGNLSTLQGVAPSGVLAAADTSGTLYLNEATGYDGLSIIQSAYQNDSDSMTAVASAIRNTIGTRNTASVSLHAASLAAAAPSNKYISNPAAMPNVNYASDNTAPVTRPFAPGGDPVFTLYLTDTTAQYKAGTYDPDDGSSATGAALNIFTDIKDLVKHVIKDTENIVRIAWQFTENAVATVITGVENVYKLAITTLEDAVTAAVALMKSVVNDVKKAIEWLSALFDLDAIFANHALIKSFVTATDGSGMLDRMQTFFKNEIADFGNEASCVQQMFKSITGQGKSSVQAVGTDPTVAGKTVQSTQSSNGTVNDAYNSNGGNNATQCKFMHHKALESDSSTITAVQRRNLVNRRLSTPKAAAVSVGDGDGPDLEAVAQAWANFVAKVAAAFADLGTLPADFEATVNGLKEKLKDPKSIAGNALADIVALFATVTDELIQLGMNIALDFLQFADALFVELVKWITQSAPDVPLLSRLYQARVGTPMTNLDVMLLIAAVPTTILMEVMTGTKTPPAGSLPVTPSYPPPAATAAVGALPADEIGKVFLGILNFSVGAIASFIDGYMFIWNAINITDANTDKENLLGNIIDLGADIASWVTGMCVSFAWNNWEAKDWGFWGGVMAFDLVWEFIQVCAQYAAKSIPTIAAVVVDSVYGIAVMAVSFVYAFLWKTSYMHAPKAPGLVLAGNLFGSLSYIVELCYFLNSCLPPNDGTVLGGIGKVLFGELNAVLGFVGYVLTVVNPSKTTDATDWKPLVTFQRPALAGGFA